MSDSFETAAIVLVDVNRVLLIRHGDGADHLAGAWGVPGGRLEKGETHREAAIREFSEETGLRVEGRHLVELHTPYEGEITYKHGAVRCSLRVYATREHAGRLRASVEGEPVWIPVEDVAALPNLLPNTAEIVAAAVDILDPRGNHLPPDGK